jgi:hypothetical protein
MKKLLTLVCTLALGSALGFAQAGGGKPENNTPSASPTQGDATAQPSTKKKATKAKKTKKAKKSTSDTAPAAAPTASPK